MELKISINGRLVLLSKATIPILDSAYLYGIGIFETLRATQGRILFLDLHVKRFRRNARLIGLKLPFSEVKRFQSELRRLLRRNHLKEATIRMMLSEDEKKLPRLVITVKPFEPYPAFCYIHGAKVIIAKSVKADLPAVARLKTTSYLTKMLARREATKRKAHEAILINSGGHVTEGASSNLFIVKKGILFTPPLSDGLLPGTRRMVVMKIAKKLKIPVREKAIRISELFQADEVFITSSLKDIMPVGFVEGTRLGKPRTDSITSALQGFYFKNYVTAQVGSN